MSDPCILNDMTDGWKDKASVLLTHGSVVDEDDKRYKNKVDAQLKKEAQKQSEIEDKRSGALDHRDRIPKEDRYKPHFFSPKQRDQAFDNCPDVPNRPGDKMDMTGRKIHQKDEERGRNFDTDHTWAHSRGGPTIPENARSLHGQSNRGRQDDPLSENLNRLWSHDYRE